MAEFKVIKFPWLPIDGHFHPRQGKLTRVVLEQIAPYFSYGTAMLNTDPLADNPKTFVQMRDHILYSLEKIGAENFIPVFTVMLTEHSTPKIIKAAYAFGAQVIKMIPRATSTGAASRGISLWELPKYYDCLRAGRDLGMVFSGHWELIVDQYGRSIAPLQREPLAIGSFTDCIENLPDLTIIAEHVSTIALAEAVLTAPANVFGSITLHHQVNSYQDVYSDNGKIKNAKLYCLPVLKSRANRIAIMTAAFFCNKDKFFFGSDAAAWLRKFKKLPNPKPGIFTPGYVSIPAQWQLFLDVFNYFGESEEAIRSFKALMHDNYLKAYGLPEKGGEMTLVKKPWTVRKYVHDIGVYLGGDTLEWQVVVK